MAIAILWRRLDVPGHDACCLAESGDGYELHGAAAFRNAGGAAHLAYRVACDAAWRALRGEVHGWIGAARKDHAVVRTPGGEWSLDGAIVPGLGPCIDLDFGFTPATNLLALRRLRLAVGAAADAPAAWLDVETAGALRSLAQRYERRSDATYWYESPSAGYAALLEVGPDAFIRRYPGLWEEER
jgi:hypothetical protein